MSVNVGTVDRTVRAALGVALLYLAFASGALEDSVWKWAAASIGVVMLVVAAIRICPLYSLFGLKTCKNV
jgi:hypothetical protein